MLMILPTRRKAGGTGALLVSRPLDIDLPQLIVRIRVWRLVNWLHGFASSSGARGCSDRFLRQNLVKEMTAAILSQCGNTLYTAGNLNNDIGVPMTLLRLTPEYDYAVIELGANHQG